MRGKRCKALRKQYTSTFGKPVERRMLVTAESNGLVYYVPSAWRRLKGLYQKHQEG